MNFRFGSENPVLSRSELVQLTGESPFYLNFPLESHLVLLPKNLPFWSDGPVNLEYPTEFSLRPLPKGNKYCLRYTIPVHEFPLGLEDTVEKFKHVYSGLDRKHFNAYLTAKGILGYLSRPNGMVYLSYPKGIVEYCR